MPCHCHCSCSKKTIYFAAALFNTRELLGNADLAECLEAKGYRVFLPQRDGFEFTKLGATLALFLPAADVNPALQDIIYTLDLAWALRNAHTALANFDEQIDPGVVVEMVYATFACNKVTIGYRTDATTPFGDFAESLCGAHFFPPYNVQHMLYNFATVGPSTTKATLEASIQDTCDKVDQVICDSVIDRTCDTCCIDENAPTKYLIEASNLLFGNVLGGLDINDPANYDAFLVAIHDSVTPNQGMQLIAQNWLANQANIKMRPKIERLYQGGAWFPTP